MKTPIRKNSSLINFYDSSIIAFNLYSWFVSLFIQKSIQKKYIEKIKNTVI